MFLVVAPLPLAQIQIQTKYGLGGSSWADVKALPLPQSCPKLDMITETKDDVRTPLKSARLKGHLRSSSGFSPPNPHHPSLTQVQLWWTRSKWEGGILLWITLSCCSLEHAEHWFVFCSHGTAYCILQPFFFFFSPPKYRRVAAELLYENSIKMCNAP